MILQYIKLSIHELFNNKLRTFLSLIGIVIGVAVVFVIFSISDITNYAVSNALTNTNGVININYREDLNDEDNGMMTSFYSTTGGTGEISYHFNLSDVESIKQIEGVMDALPHYSSNVKIILDRKSSNLSVKRYSDNFLDFYDMKLIAGHNLSDFSKNEQFNIALLEKNFVVDVMKTTPQEVIGQKITLKNRSMTIVGVVETTNSSLKSSLILKDETYDLLFSKGTIQFMSVKVAPGYDIDGISKQVSECMNQLNGYVGTKNGYAAEDLSMVLDQMSQVTGILSTVMAIIASISLLVAGVGVMNIMLVSVVERTREIGVKRALGAGKLVIQFQFIVEACLLTLMGGIMGVLLGVGIIQIALALLQMDVPINMGYVVMALLFSLSLGLIFGYFPAKRAANLNIIEAIATE